MQIFIQIDHHAIEVSKIEWIDLPNKGQITVHMDSGAKIRLGRGAANALMESISRLHSRTSIMAINASNGR